MQHFRRNVNNDLVTRWRRVRVTVNQPSHTFSFFPFFTFFFLLIDGMGLLPCRRPLGESSSVGVLATAHGVASAENSNLLFQRR